MTVEADATKHRRRLARSLIRQLWGEVEGRLHYGDLTDLQRATYPRERGVIADAWASLAPDEAFWISASSCSADGRAHPAGAVWAVTDNSDALDRTSLRPSIWFYGDDGEVYAAWVLREPASPLATEAASGYVARHIGDAQPVSVRGKTMSAIPLPTVLEVRYDEPRTQGPRPRPVPVGTWMAQVIDEPPTLTRYDIADLMALEERDDDLEEEAVTFARRLRIQARARELIDSTDVQLPESFHTYEEELRLHDEEEIEWTVGALHPRGGNTLLGAQHKAGKTTLSLNLMKALVAGHDFLGCYEVPAIDGRVGFWNYEMSPDIFRRWLADVDVEPADRFALLHLRGLRFPLTVPEAERQAIEWLKQREIEFWIIDPFVRAYGENENDNELVNRFLETLDRIKDRAGVADLLLVHHMGRKEHEEGREHVRGATRLDDWTDNRWVLTRSAEGDRFFRAEGRDVLEPQRILKFDPETRLLTLDQTEGAYGLAAARHAAASRVEKDILHIVGRDPGILAGVLRAAISGNDSAFLAAKKRLIARDELIVVKRGTRTMHFLEHDAPQEPDEESE